MELRRIGASALAACAGVMLAGCVAQTPAPETTGVGPISFAPPAAANWQWTDAPAGPTVTVHAVSVMPASSGTASLALTCSGALPSVVVAWDMPVAAAGLSYRFDGEPESQVKAQSADPRSEIVNDPLIVARFIDEAAASQQLVVRAGAVEATFLTTDDAGNLRRFRTACPDGTN
jgi:hypothetical protein